MSNQHLTKEQIRDKVVRQEVYSNVNMLVQRIAQHEPEFIYDEFENTYIYPEYHNKVSFDGGTQAQLDEKIEEVEEDINYLREFIDDATDNIYKCNFDKAESNIIDFYMHIDADVCFDLDGIIDDDEIIDTLQKHLDDAEEYVTEMEDDIEELRNLDTEVAEVYEYYIVSSRFLYFLHKKGEVVNEEENIWGRQCTGQAISLDYIIHEYCEEYNLY